MARGFESKSVADQQESAQRKREGGSPEGASTAAATALRRRRLELARADMTNRMNALRTDQQRALLQPALTAIEKELADIK